MFAGAGMMASDGRCKTMDAAADGYVRGEAVVVIKLRCVLLCPLLTPNVCPMSDKIGGCGRQQSLV